MLGNFFLKQEDSFAVLRLAVTFGRYAYAANKSTLGANGF